MYTYGEDSVVVVQSGPSLTGVAGCRKHLHLFRLLLLKERRSKGAVGTHGTS